jgi:hypothetical protein
LSKFIPVVVSNRTNIAIFIDGTIQGHCRVENLGRLRAVVP